MDENYLGWSSLCADRGKAGCAACLLTLRAWLHHLTSVALWNTLASLLLSGTTEGVRPSLEKVCVLRDWPFVQTPLPHIHYSTAKYQQRYFPQCHIHYVSALGDCRLGCCGGYFSGSTILLSWSMMKSAAFWSNSEQFIVFSGGW